nr:hypothetical protein [Tanacetum cinerariifolium]
MEQFCVKQAVAMASAQRNDGRLANVSILLAASTIFLLSQRVRTDNGMEFKNKTLAKFFDEVGITQQFSAARTSQQNGVVERRNRTLVKAARTMLTFANLPLFLWVEAISTACFTQNRSIIHELFDKTPYELINKRKPNIKFFRVFGCRCYLLNDYKDVGKLKAKGDIGVFVGYSKESAAFKTYNKQTRKIHESVNVNFDEILEMDSKQFSLEPDLSNLNEIGKSSNLSVSQVDEALKKDLEDLFQDFYDEYFDSSRIMKSSTTNVETLIIEEVFHEVSESFQGESSSSSLNDDVQQSSEEVILPQTNTQSISNNMVPNGDEASTSHNVFNERLEDAYFDATNVAEALRDADWVLSASNIPEHVYALDEALYGLKQAPWAWYDTLSQFLIESSFQKGSIDTTLFIKKKGLQVNQFSNGIFINQSKYILDILKRFGLENYDSVPTPMVEHATLKLDLVGKPVDHTDYRSMIGSLMYVTSSRPDIVFATCMCARYQDNPNEHHMSAVKRIFRYLKGTIILGLWYSKDFGFDLTAYSDSYHAGCHLDRKSTSGIVQFLGDKLVCWSSKKQNCVSISTPESEYVAVSG